MKDISYHILDIVQNSLHAGANLVVIEISENQPKGELHLKIGDNGSGMTEEVLEQVTDPFYTSSVTKKVGLGIPLLKQNTEMTGGYFLMNSKPGKGTTVEATFKNRHIDMIPMGDIGLTMKTLVATNPEINFEFSYQNGVESFTISTEELRKELGDIRLDNREVLNYITLNIRENIKALTNN